MTLRRANWPDVDDVVALSADAHVMRYFDDSLPMTAARVLAEEMPRLMAHNRRDDQLGFWVARDRGTGDFLGWFMMAPVEDSDRTARLGYRLRRQAWGEGYGAEGMLEMIKMARTAEMSTVIATTLVTNVDSRRVMEKVGLQLALAGVGDSTGPVAAAEHCEVSYTLDLSERRSC
jgi:RimJ/RimL family protein N-acetyltransferase